MDDLISRQALCEYALNQKDKSVTPNDIMRFPSAQPEPTRIIPETRAIPSDDDRVSLSERVTATYYDDEYEEWSQRTVTVRDVLDAVCDEYTVLPTIQPVATDTNDGDTISRQEAIDAFGDTTFTKNEIRRRLSDLPPVQPESLTDKEQRIFLAAMTREEKVCKQVDEEWRDCRETHDDSLVRTCHEIERKVKGALWT